jgi:glycosyltransferase involved in cell wall biosynthesis
MRIVLSVTNDIQSDQRVGRVARSLAGLPAQVIVIGRRTRSSSPLAASGYQVSRFRLMFNKGFLFYAGFNLRLFCRLLFEKADILVSNDLDTLPAVFMAAKIRRKIVVYDSHEYFTGVPELVGRKFVRKIWESIESFLLPRIICSYTVSASIAAEYNRKYGIGMQVIRNLPLRRINPVLPSVPLRIAGEKIILYQGSLNIGRGLELAISAMKYIQDTRLIIIGTGDVEDDLKSLVRLLDLSSSISFLGRLTPEELLPCTRQADLGISLEENLGLNYYYSLPNKLFDYIQAEVPVLVADLPEMAAIVNNYQVGRVTGTRDPEELAGIFYEMLHDPEKRSAWKSKLELAAKELCWENEEEKLLNIYRSASNL